MKILIRENDLLKVVDPAEVGPLAEVVATTPRAIVTVLSGNRAWRMSMVTAGLDPHPDNLLDWLWHAGMIGEEDGLWLKAVPALIADRCWSEAAYCLLMAGFAAPLRLTYVSPGEYETQVIGPWQVNIGPQWVRIAVPDPRPYAEWWAAEKQSAHREYEAVTLPAIEFVFRLPARIRRKLSTTMQAWPEDADPHAKDPANRRCKGPDPNVPAFNKWWVDNAVALLLA